MACVTRRRAKNYARPLALLGLILVSGCAHRLTAAQIAVLKEQGFKPKEDNWELGMSDKMLFDTGSDALKPATITSIEHTGGALSAVGIRNVRVEGHTDSVGSDEFNQALSERRAAAVAKALDEAKVAGPIKAIGLGKKDPVADNSTDEGRAENRRVAVIVPADQD
jgi:outer membrane protein OmpA-like peptidoglycan-associated protein